jgi:hypothetical protein
MRAGAINPARTEADHVQPSRWISETLILMTNWRALNGLTGESHTEFPQVDIGMNADVDDNL